MTIPSNTWAKVIGLVVTVALGATSTFAGGGDLNARGVEQFRAKNYQAARESFLAAAEQDNAMAMYNLALTYDDGLGVTRDPVAASGWYLRAAEHGYVPAMALIGDRMLFGKDGVAENRKEALRWLLRASEQADTESMYLLGFAYKMGLGVETNIDESMRWFRKAAEAGEVRAMTEVAGAAFYGAVGPVDHAEAARWFGKAADLGSEYGLRAYTEMLYVGQGVPRDVKAALVYARKHFDREEEAYSAMRVWLCMRAVGEPAAQWIGQYLDRNPIDDWPDPVLRFMADRITAEELLEAAGEDWSNQHHARFYIGSARLFEGDVAGAIKAFEVVADPDAFGFEADAARATLAQLRSGS